MMTGAQIQQLNHDLALRAAKENAHPFYVTAQDLVMYRAGPDATGLSIPSIGDHVPPGWRRVDIAEVWGEDTRGAAQLNAFFVDKTGLGLASEPALTLDAFLATLKPGYGYATIQEGEMQCYVGVFEHTATRGTAG